MRFKPIDDSFGAHVTEMPHSEDLASKDIDALRAAFATYHLLVFRNRAISVAEQQAIVALLGDVVDAAGDGSYYSLVSNVHKDGKAGSGRLPAHADYLFLEVPISVISLYAVEVPPTPSPTLYFNTVHAASQLKDSLRERASNAKGTFAARFGASEPFATGDIHPLTPRMEHPLLYTDPVCGCPALILDEIFCVSVSNVADEASFRSEIAKVLYHPTNRYQHDWRQHDLVVWNNVANQHARDKLPGSGARTLRKVIASTDGFGKESQSEIDRVRYLCEIVTSSKRQGHDGRL